MLQVTNPWLLTLVLIGSYVMTTQCYRVVVMEQRFQEIIKEFQHEESADNRQDKTESYHQEHNERNKMEGEISTNQKSSKKGHGNINEADSVQKQSGINTEDSKHENTDISLKNSFLVPNNINKHNNTQGQSSIDKLIESGIKSEEPGRAVNCGPRGYKMDFTWEPKLLEPKDTINMTLDMIAPVDILKAEVHADVYVAGMTTPILHFHQNVYCIELEIMMKGICPKGKISKNDHILASRTTKMQENIPLGTFTVVANITNEDNQLFLCANVTFKISSGKMDMTIN